MKKFKVIALSVGGHQGNKVFHSGDTVNESDFIAGRAKELVDQGFLEPIEEEVKKKPAPKKQPQAKKAEK